MIKISQLLTIRISRINVRQILVQIFLVIFSGCIVCFHFLSFYHVHQLYDMHILYVLTLLEFYTSMCGFIQYIALLV
jgi:hypothetical protein